MSRWAIALGLVSLGAVGFALGYEPRRPAASGPVDVRQLVADAGLPSEWGDFLAMVAFNESRNNPHAINDDPTEVKKSAEGYERIRSRFEACDHPDTEYTWGSGGLFGQMPAFAFSQVQKHRCMDPRRIHEPKVALATAVAFARGLMGYEGYKANPTWLNLRAMWKWPARAGDVDYLEERRPNYERHAGAVGLPPGWLDRQPPPLTRSGDEMLEHLGVAA